MMSYKNIVSGDFKDCFYSKKAYSQVKNIFYPADSLKQTEYKKYLTKGTLFKAEFPPVLLFYASLNDCNEFPRDRMKFRKCHVLFYMEDGSIKVCEPLTRNSGYPQKCIVNRNKIPKDEGFYSLEDMIIGETITLYGKSFKLLDCNDFTRNVLRELGFRVKGPQPGIDDPVVADRAEADNPRTSIRNYIPKCNKRAKFQKDFPKSLHFYAIYERSPPHVEDVKYVSFYYNLFDGTIKIVEDSKIRHQNRLKEGFDSCFILKPILVPKNGKKSAIGDSCLDTILNFSANTRKMKLDNILMKSERCLPANNFLLDANPRTEKDCEYYSAKDFLLGGTLNIFGAKVFLYDCDEFTKNFYRTEFNMDLQPLVPEKTNLKSKCSKIVYPQQIGSFQDSLMSCNQIGSLKPTRENSDFCNGLSDDPLFKLQNFLKFQLNSKSFGDFKVLRFVSTLITSNLAKKHQHFIIEFHLEDDTIQILELKPYLLGSCQNSSVYLKRLRLNKPTTNPLNSDGCFYTKTDMFVGNTICSRTETFYLLDADEYTLTYMEKNCDIFVYSDIKYVLNFINSKVRENASNMQLEFETHDKFKLGFVTFDTFRTILIENLKKDSSLPLCEQQIRTLARFFATEEGIGLEFEDLVSKIQIELKKQRFMGFEKLKSQFEEYDINYGRRNGFLKTSETYTVLVSYPLPVNRDLLKCYLVKIPKYEDLIDFNKIIETLNYIEYPSTLSNSHSHVSNINWERIEKRKNMHKINYCNFLKGFYD